MSASGLPADYEDALARAGIATLDALSAMESVMRWLHPPELGTLREQVRPYHETLGTAVGLLRSVEPPDGLEAFQAHFIEGATLAHRALAMFRESPRPEQAIAQVLASRRTFCRALDVLYGLRLLPPLGRYFVEPAFHDRIGELDPEPPDGISVGLHQTTTDGGETESRGGFCLYVPERYDGSTAWPLVVALHGASGNGQDFIWTWLREARGRGFFVLAPSSRGSTWSMMGPDVDGPALRAMVEYVAERWRVKETSVLLTGLSDGGTYALLSGMEDDSPFTALASISGTLHPATLGPGRLHNVRGRRIYMVNGALDWLFPITLTRAAGEMLREAGADIVFREIDDLSHTYPREENDRILTWFDPTLALPTVDDASPGR